ncbi:DUF72 domain-containing protein [Paracoccus suum]|uniref:DUF72 domain-containing protein n=1 Tax=Paracoccus suum TaxID=2259340 RepID=A0A344PLV1_9RHOB|nr:DUF72 domain-containing protein [Paracoccus suum]AXC50356.1 DUF72 domain-containing protein [Paracoccus suum]
MIRIGVGGWNFPEWRGGAFYPDGLRQADELAHMASRLNAVEVNGTFYRSQSPQTYRAWADATPKDFSFALKAPRYATNRKVLAEAGESVTRFTEGGLAELGDKLGPINWQLAPTKKFERDDFARFLDLLPQTGGGLPLRHAVEVRHESFLDPAFAPLCTERGVAIILDGDSTYPSIDSPTADFAYLRIMGTTAGEALGYSEAALDRWAQYARGLQGDVWMFVIAGEKRLNPRAAEALSARI